MSYYQQQQTINQFIPNYVVKSDYLPTRVVDGNSAQTAQLVHLFLCSSASMRRRREEAECSPRDLPSSTLTDMLHSESMKMWELMSLLTNNISVGL